MHYNYSTERKAAPLRSIMFKGKELMFRINGERTSYLLVKGQPGTKEGLLPVFNLDNNTVDYVNMEVMVVEQSFLMEVTDL